MEGGNATAIVVFSTYGERQLIATLFCIITVVGTLGNCLVIWAVCLSVKLRTVPNTFVINLSLADLMTSLATPWQVVALLSVNIWPLPDWLCVMVGLCGLVTIGCSLNTLTLIAINRFVLVTRAKATYQMMYRPKWIAIMLIAAWAYPLIIAAVPLVSEFGELGFDSVFSTCAWVTTTPLSAAYAIFVAIMFFPIQLGIIVVCYVSIFLHLYKHNRAVSQSALSTAEAVSHISHHYRPQVQQNQKRRQNELTKNLFYIICAFVVCVIPHGICIMRSDTYKVLPYASVLLLTNSCINPFIYGMKHSDFKKVFGCILRCKFNNIPGRAG